MFGEQDSWIRLLWGALALILIVILEVCLTLWIVKREEKKNALH
jgi:hypothetical protein